MPPPVVAPAVVPEVEMKRRVSSPVEIAGALRQSPAQGRPVMAESSISEHPASPPTPDPRPLTPAPEDYAAVLARRLAAMAPPELDESEQMDRDERPLRERVRSAEGVADLLMFRIGPEIFATDLAAVEEAVSLPEIHHLPEMPAAMLGAFNLRGRLTPVYSPAHVIGVPLAGAAQAALLVSANGRRLGLAVDDVEDVFQVDLATVREAPGIDDADGILLGVAHHGQELVTVLDAEALVAACLTGHVMETA
ncbi:MAG: purine-binding chemotaxis protein CheW [Gemmatimonadaceae bacterium]|nr:purine-binding chemotaxis protein CheW [Gemmatimonadaceae bacterium]